MNIDNLIKNFEKNTEINNTVIYTITNNQIYFRGTESINYYKSKKYILTKKTNKICETCKYFLNCFLIKRQFLKKKEMFCNIEQCKLPEVIKCK